MSASSAPLPGTARLSRGRGSDGLIFAVGLLGVTAVFALIAQATAPRPFALAMMVELLVMLAWFVKPLVGLCATVFLALLADYSVMSWYPFVKGFSAQETILYISPSFVFSPMELVIVTAFVALLFRYLVLGAPTFISFGRMPYAVGAFTLFVGLALVRGFRLGGDHTIALYQARPFFALASLYLLTTTVCRRPSDYRWLMWATAAAMATHAVISTVHIFGLSPERLKLTEGIIEHGAAMRMDVFILLVAAAWLFKGTTRMRWILTPMLLPITFVYLVSERRAAVIGLAAAFPLLAVVLFWKRRRLFFKVVPVIVLVFVAYVGAFWNSTSSSGFPAQAVKSVIAPTEISDRNQSSDAYRIAENLDLHYTIQTSKVFGIGLGKAFLRPYPLPDLGTNFAYAPYIPHNSFLWVWASMGIGGFASMIYLIGRAISLGAAKVRAAPVGQDLVVLLTFVLAVVVFVVYCYVDIAWDAGNMTMLGVAVAVCSGYPVHELRRDEDDSPPASEHHDLVASTPVGVR